MNGVCGRVSFLLLPHFIIVFERLYDASRLTSNKTCCILNCAFNYKFSVISYSSYIIIFDSFANIIAETCLTI